MTAAAPEKEGGVLAVGPGLAEVSAALARLGLRVTAAANAAEAIPRLAGQSLVLASYEQPIAQLYAEAPHTPLVVVGAPPAAVTQLLAAGAVDVFAAPMNLEVLQARVRALLALTRNVKSVAHRISAEARARAEQAQREAEQASRLKDQFIATLSHEMRTPLTAILGWVRLLRLGKASADPAGRPLETIERNARLQAQLVDDLLDVQRIASGRMSLSFRDLEVGTLLEGVVQGMRPDAEEAAVQVQLTRPVDEEMHLLGDPERLHQIFSSLLSNAVKFSLRGGKVRVQLQPVGTEAMVLFQDEGRGIAPEFLPRLFEPFALQEGGLARHTRGVGIGLSIVRQVVELHGGTVSAESEGEGRGARFTVALPMVARVAKPASQREWPPEPRPPLRHDLQDLRVLVVEDDVDTQALLVTLLEQVGARVTAAGSAAAAFKSLQEATFDLLLSDISMPGEDGYSLMRRIRSGSVQPGIPAVALTANASNADRARALAAGFHVHVAKPVEPLELAQILAGLVRV